MKSNFLQNCCAGFLLFSISNYANALETSASDVWSAISETPYPGDLPQHRIDFDAINGSDDKGDEEGAALKAAAERTLAVDTLLIDSDKPKLLHPNGVCLKGIWEVNNDNEFNPYTGYFSNGSTAIIIARASVDMNNTKHEGWIFKKPRGFGMGGVLFPSTNDNSVVNDTASFFVVDTLGGTTNPHYINSKLTNKPAISILGVARNIGIDVFKAGIITTVLSQADKENTEDQRQQYQIAEMGLSPSEQAITPEFFRISTDPDHQRVTQKDFRDELDVTRYNNQENQIIFNIEVGHSLNRSDEEADTKDPNSVEFVKIGIITFSESATSRVCDEQFHIPHPIWKEPSTGEIQHYYPGGF